jgi:undecaprenyl-diphosphatase
VALLLLVAEKIGSRRRGMEELGLLDAVVVGCAQVIALIPGASRSGSTIMGGLFAGQKRETAARFSFLLSIPAIAASGLLEMREAAEMLPEGSAMPLVVATIVSAVVGWASIYFLLRFLRNHSTNIFIVYRVALGLLIVALLLSGVVRPLDSAEPGQRADGVETSAPVADSRSR